MLLRPELGARFRIGSIDLAVVNARAQVPEDQAPRVHQGQSCTFVPVDTALGTFNGALPPGVYDVVVQRATGHVIAATHGRGIFLINQLMDEVRYERGGTQIYMRKG